MNSFRLPAWVVGAVFLLPSCGESNEVDSEKEPAAIEVENPCDCFDEGISEGQRRYCRESKRDTRFLEALRKCRIEEGVSPGSKMPIDGQYTMDTAKSVVKWTGSKAGIQEQGTIKLKSCSFLIDQAMLVKGSMVLNMNGIEAASQEGKAAQKLTRDLRSKEFFDVAQFPTASFDLVSSSADNLGNLKMSGELTIKGKTKKVVALMRFASVDPVIATVKFVFNRSEFDVQYGSGSLYDSVGDNLISDEMIIQMALIEDGAARTRE